MPPLDTRALRLLGRLPRPDPDAAWPGRDPWQQILAENVAYLASDEARRRAFARLHELTGLDARNLARCPDELLEQACGSGRRTPQQIAKLRSCAACFFDVGDPRELVRLPGPQARKALKRFPGIGDPGVDRLRLLAGVEPVLALDSNGLRVLLRLGYGQEAKSYSTSYRSAQRAAQAELPADCEVLLDAYLRLRQHGKELCRRTAPACVACPLRTDCPSAG